MQGEINKRRVMRAVCRRNVQRDPAAKPMPPTLLDLQAVLYVML